MESEHKKQKKEYRLTGRYTAHPRGFGFVEFPEEEEREDVFIPPTANAGALDGDVVEILARPSGGARWEGEVLQILEHSLKSFVGTYEQSKNYGFVIPDNPKITADVFITKEHSLGARNGQKVVVDFLSYGGRGKSPEGIVTTILGYPGDPGVDVASIVRDYDVPEAFSKKMENQAERVAKPVSAADLEGRMDLRDWLTVTIDGEDAKDLDDAVTLRKEGEDYILGVHIADVSNYVQENSALDREAKRRGTSIYLVDRVIPMLPRTLSNGICSLNQGEDRLTLSCIMRINADGEVTDHQIAESVIRSDRRLTYTAVNAILTEQEPGLMAEYHELVPMLFLMKELSDRIRVRRKARGSIDFDIPETKVILDDMGRPAEIRPYDRNAATRLIEDFMLAANETVAEDYYWQGYPFVYRVHEAPKPEKMKALRLLLANLGVPLRGATAHEIHPKEYQKLLAAIADSPQENLVTRLTLRSMQQARYQTECIGHFGLAARYYCHFTSPIRRYPDLQIHRIIKENIRRSLKEERIEHYNKILPEVAKQSSLTERRAEEMERESVKMKMAEYMEARIGEEYDGIISGVTAFGLFVELPNTIEGLVPMRELRDDYYQYDADRLCLTGERTGRTYELGQSVRVAVTGASKAMRTVDFALAE